MNCYYFFPEDFRKLNHEIEQIICRIKQIGHEMGQSCQEGAETFHDNFAYEEGERQQTMWSRRLRDFMKVKEKVQLVPPGNKPEKVALGSQITIFDEDAQEEKTFVIGSYMTFDNPEAISYNAPLAKQLIGASEGDICECIIAGKKRIYEILKIC
jgi:transcription elongation GreA/GreB family factor